MTTWLLHAVGDADLVADSSASVVRAERVAALTSTIDAELLARRLRGLDWDGRVTGTVSPLGFAAGSVTEGPEPTLVLVASATTRPIADAIAGALTLVPTALGRVFGRVIPVDVADGESGGLGEREVTAALTPVLAAAHHDDDVLITWGSGSTQLALGMLDAVASAGLPWRLANVAPQVPTSRYQVFAPTDGMTVDPIIPLLRRWRYHDLLAATTRDDADAERWRRAHLAPDADSLRAVVADALARGDATSGFAVRQYIWVRYEELRAEDASAPLDLRRWAADTLGGSSRKLLTGRLLQAVRQPRFPADPVQAGQLRQSLNSPSGQWLASDEARALNEAGKRSSHSLTPPPAGVTRRLRRATGIGPATMAWYVGVLGNGADAERRDGLLLGIADRGADPSVRDYLGMSDATDVGLRFLVLGTASGSAGYAKNLAARLGADRATADTVPDPHGDPVGTPATAYSTLERHYRTIAADIGAIVLVPTGPKPCVLPLIMAGHRIAAEHGVPFYLRQLAGDGDMHRLPLRYGGDRDLLDLARHALSTMELDVAARLLDAGGRSELADRTRRLANALFCRNTDFARWPTELPPQDSLLAITRGLIADRLEPWAELAERHSDPTHSVRAVCGASAVLAQSLLRSVPTDDSERTWTRFRSAIDRSTATTARVLSALFHLRDDLPITHGAPMPANGTVDHIVAERLTLHGVAHPGRETTVPGFIRLAAEAARRHPELAAAPNPHQGPTLSTLLADLRRDIDERLAVELARLGKAEAQRRRLD